jgi:hypothetical protein
MTTITTTSLAMTIIGFMVSLAAAQCQSVGVAGTSPDIQTDTGLCVPQGPGFWTFSMRTTLVCVPDLYNLAGCEPTASMAIYDESCNFRSGYSVPSCGTPFIIEENFLSDVLMMNTISTDPGDSSFDFNYGNGKFSTGNNGCACEKGDSGLELITRCKCAFPVNGVLGKRSIRFEA